MQRAATFILSVLTSVASFACTGQRDGGGARAGGEGGTAGSGTGGSSGSALGGASSGGASSGGASSGGLSSGGGSDVGGGGSSSRGGSGVGGGDGGSGVGGGESGTGGSGGGSVGGNAGGGSGGAGGGGGMPAAPSLLVFSRTAGFVHDSIPSGLTALANMADDRGWSFFATEDPNTFSDSGLAPYDVIVFLSTSGDVFDAQQQAAFERFIRAGGGWVGIHAASTTEYDWPFFGGLVGAFFDVHPDVQQAVVRVENATHPATMNLPSEWRRTDEWYSFRTNPRPNVTVLLTVDETTYDPGDTAMGADHPIAWFHTYEGARSFYTSLGHTLESYSDPVFLGHLAGGIEWAIGR